MPCLSAVGGPRSMSPALMSHMLCHTRCLEGDMHCTCRHVIMLVHTVYILLEPRVYHCLCGAQTPAPIRGLECLRAVVPHKLCHTRRHQEDVHCTYGIYECSRMYSRHPLGEKSITLILRGKHTNNHPCKRCSCDHILCRTRWLQEDVHCT